MRASERESGNERASVGHSRRVSERAGIVLRSRDDTLLVYVYVSAAESERAGPALLQLIRHIRLSGYVCVCVCVQCVFDT